MRNGEVAYKSDIFKERYSETSTRGVLDQFRLAALHLRRLRAPAEGCYVATGGGNLGRRLAGQLKARAKGLPVSAWPALRDAR